MPRVLASLLAALGVLPAGVLFAAVVGLGVMRELSPAQTSAAATLLVTVPIAGLWSLFGRGAGAAAAATWGWPVLVLVGLPGFFPGELPGAVATGFGTLGAAGGEELARSAARAGEVLGEPMAAAPTGRAPPPEATPAGPECPPPAPMATSADAVALPYEGQGHSLAIPVQFGDVELQMLFDTGATFTTLDRASLRRLGVAVPADAPEITLRTANGERTARLVLVPQVWVGGFLVEGVTVGVCDECADEHTSGLLGLNVSGQFLVTVDTARREVVFQERTGDPDRVVDVSPWLKVRSGARAWSDGRVEVEVTGENVADRPVRQTSVGIHCGDDAFAVRLGTIAPGTAGTATATLPRGVACDPYRVTLDSARW